MSLESKAQEIKEKYPQLDVDFNERRNQIGVYGFHALEHSQEARQELEEMGFELGPNGGTLKEEKQEEEIVIEAGVTKLDVGYLQMTPQERMEIYRDRTPGHDAEVRLEQGWFSDEQVIARMFPPRLKAAMEYINNQ